jgi:uncharacterized protein
MVLARLIEALSAPAAYPFPLDQVKVCQTHISVVFLAGAYAYKIKKPVNLSFLDFTTLAQRRHACDEEVRLNRRLAPEVYLGVVPVTTRGASISMDAQTEGAGEIVEWAVKMQRLPDDATLLTRLRRGEVGCELVEALGLKIAGFHASAESGQHVSAFGRFDVVAANTRENFHQAQSQVGVTVSPAVFERVQALTEAALQKHRPLIEARAARGVPRDTHGDLHLDHVYLFPDRPPPADLVIIDCIEFNDRFRFSDPVADMAFLHMDIAFHGRRDLAGLFADAYFRAAQDEEGRALLPLYSAYRAVIRAKVEGLELGETEIPEDERSHAVTRAHGHWLLALAELETPGRRPCLVLVGGLPGSGKSTLAWGLAQRAGFQVIRSDVVRKELAGPSFPGDIYTSAWTQRTYAECLRRAEQALFQGQRVVVDASFITEDLRRPFLDAAARWGVQAALFICQTDAQTACRRLDQRRGDVSDADWSVRQSLALRWEELAPNTGQCSHAICTSGTPEEAQSLALGRLMQLALYA